MSSEDFRTGQGATDGFYCQKGSASNSPNEKLVFLLFVELTAAFDYLEREWLF